MFIINKTKDLKGNFLFLVKSFLDILLSFINLLEYNFLLIFSIIFFGLFLLFFILSNNNIGFFSYVLTRARNLSSSSMRSHFFFKEFHNCIIFKSQFIVLYFYFFHRALKSSKFINVSLILFESKKLNLTTLPAHTAFLA